MKHGSIGGRFAAAARGSAALGICLAAVAQSAAAQVSWDLYQVGAIPTASPPTIDGYLDEGAWQGAGLITDFVQQEPNEGAPASEATEVRVLYDARTLYLGVRAYDSDPAGVTATEMRRDSDQHHEREDNFQIILDTFKDSRSAYMFVTNPLRRAARPAGLQRG